MMMMFYSLNYGTLIQRRVVIFLTLTSNFEGPDFELRDTTIHTL
jgi:hypothetical protein